MYLWEMTGVPVHGRWKDMLGGGKLFLFDGPLNPATNHELY